MSQEQQGGQQITREFVVLQAIAGAQSDEQIAVRSKLDVATVRAIVTELISQFEVTNRSELVAEALRRGLQQAQQQRIA